MRAPSQPDRIVVTGKTLDDIASQVRVEHGPRARIVEASRVTSGGIAGLFTKKYVEATVELPARGRRAAGGEVDAPSSSPAAAHSDFQPSPAQRVGLAALLAEADEAEDVFAVIDDEPPVPPVSTRSASFAELMDDLAFNGVVPERPIEPKMPIEPEMPTEFEKPVEAESLSMQTYEAEPFVASVSGPGHPDLAVDADPVDTAPVVVAPAAPAVREAPAAPALLDGPGDLIVVLGRPADVVGVAQAMADTGTGPRAAVRVAGTAATGRFVAVEDRRSALEARASGVELDRATIVAVGWDSRGASLAAAIAPDQIWIAVDAGRKHADTERFLARVTALVAADGLAVVGLDDTTTPETVEQLGLPIGWSGTI